MVEMGKDQEAQDEDAKQGRGQTKNARSSHQSYHLSIRTFFFNRPVSHKTAQPLARQGGQFDRTGNIDREPI
jgi:hypothetical protein